MFLDFVSFRVVRREYYKTICKSLLYGMVWTCWLILTYIQTVSYYTRIWGLGLTATVTEHRLPGPIPTNRPFGQNIYVIELMIEALAKLRAPLRSSWCASLSWTNPYINIVFWSLYILLSLKYQPSSQREEADSGQSLYTCTYGNGRRF